MKGRRILLVIAAGATSAGLAYLGTGLHPVWWCLWLAPVPVLALATRLGRGAAFLLAFSAWLLGALNEWNYFTHGIEVPLPLIAIVILVPALVFGLCVLFARSFLLRGSLFLGAFAFPVSWVAYEYLTEVGSPNSTFGNLGYTQMDFLPIIQIASITGIWGISFIVFLFAGTIASAFERRRKASTTPRTRAHGRRLALPSVFLRRVALVEPSCRFIRQSDADGQGCAD